MNDGSDLDEEVLDHILGKKFKTCETCHGEGRVKVVRTLSDDEETKALAMIADARRMRYSSQSSESYERLVLGRRFLFLLYDLCLISEFETFKRIYYQIEDQERT